MGEGASLSGLAENSARRILDRGDYPAPPPRADPSDRRYFPLRSESPRAIVSTRTSTRWPPGSRRPPSWRGSRPSPPPRSSPSRQPLVRLPASSASSRISSRARAADSPLQTLGLRAKTARLHNATHHGTACRTMGDGERRRGRIGPAGSSACPWPACAGGTSARGSPRSIVGVGATVQVAEEGPRREGWGSKKSRRSVGVAGILRFGPWRGSRLRSRPRARIGIDTDRGKSEK